MISAIWIAALSLFFIYLEFFLPGAILGIFGGVGLLFSTFLFISKSDHVLKSVVFVFIIGGLVALLVKLALRRLKKSAVFFPRQGQFGHMASSFDETLIGQMGKAASDLKPSGYVLVNGRRYPAISESRYIKKGESIKVVKGQGGYFIVQTL